MKKITSDDCKALLVETLKNEGKESAANDWKRTSKKQDEQGRQVRIFSHPSHGIRKVIEKDGQIFVEGAAAVQSAEATSDYSVGDQVHVLIDYILFKGTIAEVGNGECTVDIPAQHFWGARKTKVKNDRIVRPDERIAVVQNKKGGLTTYHIEKVEFAEQRKPAGEWEYKDFIKPDELTSTSKPKNEDTGRKTGEIVGAEKSGIEALLGLSAGALANTQVIGVGQDGLTINLFSDGSTSLDHMQTQRRSPAMNRRDEPKAVARMGKDEATAKIYDLIINHYGVRQMRRDEDSTNTDWHDLLKRFLMLKVRRDETLSKELNVKFEAGNIVGGGVRLFDFDNDNAFSFLITAGNQNEIEVSFHLYVGNDGNLHIRVPVNGNPFNTDTMEAYGHNMAKDTCNIAVRWCEKGINPKEADGKIRKDAMKLWSIDDMNAELVEHMIQAPASQHDASRVYDNEEGRPFLDEMSVEQLSKLNSAWDFVRDVYDPSSMSGNIVTPSAEAVARAEKLIDRFCDRSDDNRTWEELERMAGGTPDERAAVASQLLFSVSPQEDDDPMSDMTEGCPFITITPVKYWQQEGAAYDNELPIRSLLGPNSDAVSESTWILWDEKSQNPADIAVSLINRGFAFDMAYQAHVNGGLNDTNGDIDNAVERAQMSRKAEELIGKIDSNDGNAEKELESMANGTPDEKKAVAGRFNFGLIWTDGCVGATISPIKTWIQHNGVSAEEYPIEGLLWDGVENVAATHWLFPDIDDKDTAFEIAAKNLLDAGFHFDPNFQEHVSKNAMSPDAKTVCSTVSTIFDNMRRKKGNTPR